MPFVHGFHPVREALRRRPHRIVRVLVARRESGPRVSEIAELCARHGVRLEMVDWSELRRIVADARQGIAAEVTEVAETPGKAEDLPSGVGAAPSRVAPGGSRVIAVAPEARQELDSARSAPAQPARRKGVDPELVVLLEDIQDPRNLGALLRVCEGAGVGRVLIRDRGAAPLTPTVVAASAGATEWLEVERVTNTVAELERLKESGFWAYGAAEGGAAPWEVDLTGPIVLCFGGEEKGLRRLTRESCDGLIGLPMRGRVESLNVATAAAALLYDAVRQRTSPRPAGKRGEPAPE